MEDADIITHLCGALAVVGVVPEVVGVAPVVVGRVPVVEEVFDIPYPLPVSSYFCLLESFFWLKCQ